MADDDDQDYNGDESAYDLGPARRERAEEVITMPMSVPGTSESSSEPAPEWAKSWKVQQARPARLKGACVKWQSKGFGFLKRDDGLPDLYVHQRDLQKKGYRSLMEGERVEFDVAAMDDGRLHAVRVTGPGGVDVQGQPDKRDKGDDSDSDVDEKLDERGAGGKAPKAASSTTSVAPPKPYTKPATAFLPRAVARPKPNAKPKPKPVAAQPPP